MKKLIFLSFSIIFILSGCSNQTTQTENWGSFTAEKTWSYDEEYYAIQRIEEDDGTSYIVVSICSTVNDEIVGSFVPARATDFWGVCWENNTYNLWVQSGDIGTQCYKYEDGLWEIDPLAVRPDYIQSKYD